MPERAHVTSVEAIEDFRSKLVVYVSKARPTVEEVSSEIARTRSWLQNDQRLHWEAQVRRRIQILENAKQALSSARISNLQKDATFEQMAVQKAKRALDEAEAKLKMIKNWTREFDGRVEPLLKQLEKLHTFLAHDLVMAAAYLHRTIATLKDYAQAGPTPADMVGGDVAKTPGATEESALPDVQPEGKS
jgi:hypothetical protein